MCVKVRVTNSPLFPGISRIRAFFFLDPLGSRIDLQFLPYISVTIKIAKEFSSAKSVGNVVKTGSIEQSWVNIFSDLRNKQIYMPNLIKILDFVLSVPGSNALTERVFSLMSNKLTD
jgi:hypothetical protein